MQQSLDFLHLQDPKNYKFLPPQFTGAIRAAGTGTRKGDTMSSLMNNE
jgi:hypothetical protein